MSLILRIEISVFNEWARFVLKSYKKKEINFSGQAILIIYPCFRAEFKRPAA
tara:strand:+ start:976 stop:1131 length:156 start_codon:yes stop_codon:yes gene_type:complete